MKCKIIIGLSAILYFTGCYNREQTPRLSEAEKLMQNNPDSALAILQKLKPEGNRAEQARYALLYSEALEKKQMKVTDDSLIRQAWQNIVAYREENGRFGSRNQLLKVAKLGPKAYEQCAGFMRITDGKNPLDATGVHPESYDATKKLLDKLGFTMEDVKNRNLDGISKKISNYDKLAEELGIGAITLQDIVKELEKPARDPREDMPKPILRSDVLEMKDLTPGMVLKGTVRNVIDFGAFVDIGVHQDGLVHISQMSDKFIKHPLEVVSVGDIVEVKVMSIDLKKQRIQLTMKL